MIMQKGLNRLRDGVRIINICSGVARVAIPDIIGYASGSRGITVKAVAPGIVDTDMNASWLRGDAAAWEAAAQMSHIADVVGFLASRAGP